MSYCQRLEGGKGQWLLVGVGFLFRVTTGSGIRSWQQLYNTVNTRKPWNCTLHGSEFYNVQIISQTKKNLRTVIFV